MPRILHVTESLAGGIVQSIATICRAASGEAELYLLHSRRPETPDDLSVFYPDDVTFIEWKACRELNPVQDIASLMSLRRVVAEIKPDIIHAHSSKAGALVRLAYPLGRRPTICYSPRGYSFLRGDISMAMRAIYHCLEWMLGRTGGLTIAAGVGEYGLALRHARHVTLITNAVPLPQGLPPVAARQEGSDLEVVAVGRITPQKNFPQFVEIARRMENDPVRFTWIGGGEGLDELALPKNMRITGWLKRAEVLEQLVGADLFVQTSLYEALSLALIEAMMLGLPALAKPGIGNTELVVDGQTGHLCDSTDDFVDRIRAGLADRQRLREMGDYSSQLATRTYSLESVTPRWRSLYQYVDRYRRYG